MVDIALGDKQYDPKPLYFVISKRVYSESGNNEYQKACSYLGSKSDKPGEHFTGYTPGMTVEWNDTNVRRGVKYEYMVQSYVDDTPKLITSDASKSSAVGWALDEGTLSFGKVNYVLGSSLYVSAEFPLIFEFDPQNISYNFNLLEKIEPLDDTDPFNPDTIINNDIPFDSYNDVRAYVTSIDLTKKTTKDNRGRGVYSYQIEILLNGITLDTISALGKIEVSENINPIIVENFRVQDGYADKFVLIWDNCLNRKYELYTVDAKGENAVLIGTVNDNPVDTDTTVINNFSYSYSAGVTTGITRYFAIRPYRKPEGDPLKHGQMVYAAAPARTLGVPKASLDDDSTYNSITAAWIEAQKADTYRVRYRYTEGADTAYKTAATVKKEALSIDAFGKYKYTFKPEGDEIDISKAGLEIQIQIEALNEGLRKLVGGGEISTSSTEDVRTRLVGPALLDLSVSKAVSPQDINVSWKKIPGAGGYYVFRRQFNMTNTAEDGAEAVVYYVFERPIVSITGKGLLLENPSNLNSPKIDTTTVKASIVFADGRYTLTDTYMPDNEYDVLYFSHTPAYKDQQNDIAQGCSYRYYVVPVISDSHTALNSILFEYNKDSSNKNTSIDRYTMENGEIKYSGAAAIERDGFTFGFGQNVTATKGTFVSGTYNDKTNNVNNGVKVTWSKPPRLPDGFNPRYTVYRKRSGGSEWDTLTTTNANITEFSEAQKEGDRGFAFEYVIGISRSDGTPGSDPRYNRRFINNCYNQLDDKSRPKMLGFMLNYVEMESVSRNEQKVGDKFAEEVRWFSAGIKHRDGEGYKWGIDGYEVFVMNRNINAEWHKITEIKYADIPDQNNQSVKVSTGMGSVTLNTTAGNMSFDLLRVMRDYKHFFKIRSYVLNDFNEKVYCPDPVWTYTYQFGTSEADHIAKSNAMQNQYVKWGARQITKDEFIKIASVYAGRGISGTGGGAGDNTFSAGTSGGASGSVTQDYTYQGATDAHKNYKFNNFKVNLSTRTGQSMTFITINGNIWSRTYPIGAWPFRYGEDGWVTITGPWDTPGLYTGQIIFGANKNPTVNGSNNGGFSWNGNGTLSGGTSTSESGAVSARVAVKYPSSAAEEQFLYRGRDTALQFKGESNNRWDLEDYK
jgi:hypothetical protein